jgi:anti-anti-sigma factor
MQEEGVVHLKEDKKGDVIVLRFKGRLDAISTPDAEKRVQEFIKKGEIKLLMDFSEVDYISSAGMRLLLSTTKQLKFLAGHLVICSMTTNVMDVFKLSGFDHVLELTNSEEEALKKF